MNKYSIAIVMMCLSVAAFAQNASTTDNEPFILKSKKGIPILPEAGEWALGISANPFLTYAGNVLNGNTFNSSPAFTYGNSPANNIAIFGKYMVDANTAYRVRFNASVNTTVDKAIVAQNELTPDPLYPAFAEDWRKNSRKTVVIAAGYEKRRGKSRIQGVYGGELIIGYAGQKQVYEYGNAVSADFNAPITNNFGGNILSGTAAAAVHRKTEEKFGTTFSIAARGFIGVEYFVGPKISLGAEFGYSLGFSNTSRGLVTSERWNPGTTSVLQTKTDVSNNGYTTFIGTSLDNLNGNINLLFYF